MALSEVSIYTLLAYLGAAQFADGIAWSRGKHLRESIYEHLS